MKYRFSIGHSLTLGRFRIKLLVDRWPILSTSSLLPPPLPQLSMISRYKPIVDGNRNVYQPSRRRKGERWELVVIPSESLWLRPRKMVKPYSIPFSLSPLPLFSLSLSFPFFAIFVRSTVSTLEKR